MNVHLPTYDLRDNILLLPYKREEAMKRKVREAVEAKYSDFTGVEMPIEATAAIDIFAKPLKVANQKLKGEIRILRDSHEAILNRLSTLENTPQRLLVPPNDTPSTKPSAPIPTEQPATTPTFASIAARKPQLRENNGVPRKVSRVIMKGTQQADEKTITANPLLAQGLRSRDFAIRAVPKHITAEKLSAYLQGIGVKPRFVRIFPIGPDDTKSSTVGRIGINTSDVDVLLKAENWSSSLESVLGKPRQLNPTNLDFYSSEPYT
ncbi:LOW QUALITY PROTEIN: hypothetical protein RvY_17779 [Ramazzottius varieornatus]|uniref:Uncharacterized protein n=1 Tax=Ramazzottius varieornatus TaxID=947166 RepID=A0A1D1W3J0_RAMVA|nr:LOW QUALITY PROTEIN: hypothetical protein RvY_17779 [Ramazzottius varieornatus]